VPFKSKNLPGFIGVEGFASTVPAGVAKFGQWTAAWTGETHIVEMESAFLGEDFRDRWIHPKARGQAPNTKAFR
jgi:predicted flap endonuclease-1-like 5' DNA nuclease